LGSSGTKWYLVGVAALFPALNVLAVFWAAQSAANPLRPFSVIDLLYWVALWGGGGLAIAALAGSRLVSVQLSWWRVTRFVAGTAALTNIVNGYVYFDVSGYLVLYRDIAAAVVFVVALTLIVSRLARRMYERNLPGRKRMIICGSVASIALIPTPILSLVVHCSSGLFIERTCAAFRGGTDRSARDSSEKTEFLQSPRTLRRASFGTKQFGDSTIPPRRLEL